MNANGDPRRDHRRPSSPVEARRAATTAGSAAASIRPWRRSSGTTWCEDYRTLAAANGIGGSVLVQAAQTVAETRWLLDQARASDGLIQGVVGWIDMAAPMRPDA